MRSGFMGMRSMVSWVGMVIGNPVISQSMKMARFGSAVGTGWVRRFDQGLSALIWFVMRMHAMATAAMAQYQNIFNAAVQVGAPTIPSQWYVFELAANAAAARHAKARVYSPMLTLPIHPASSRIENQGHLA